MEVAMFVEKLRKFANKHGKRMFHNIVQWSTYQATMTILAFLGSPSAAVRGV